MEAPRAGATPVQALRALSASFVALLAARVELAVVELREEAERRTELAVLGATAGVFAALAALLFALLVVLLFWETHRVAAAGAVTLAYLAIALAALGRLRRRARESPPPFQATLAELERDVRDLRGEP